MKYLILLVLFSVKANAEMVKIAVIDSGFTKLSVPVSAKLCSNGHADTTLGKIIATEQPPIDSSGSYHGTNIAHIISESIPLEYVDRFCIVVIRAWPPKANGPSALAIKHARKLGVKIINYSGGGKPKSKRETREIEKALDAGIEFVAAAGNNGLTLGEAPSKKEKEKYTTFYPAMADPRVTVVGSVNNIGEISTFSNRSDIVDVYEKGEEISGAGISLTGTSQATAVASGRILKFMIEKIMKEESKGANDENLRYSSGRD